MTKQEFKNEYLQNAFFWINEENHIKIQEIMQEFGVRCVTGSGFIKWHEGFKNLCTFPPNGFTGHDFYQKVDMWIPDARYGEPKNIERFLKDYEALS